MAMSTTRDAGRFVSSELAAGLSATRLEQFRVDRLLELRALIDSLRTERTSVSWLDNHTGLNRLRKS
jgi:hypothetical protein